MVKINSATWEKSGILFQKCKLTSYQVFGSQGLISISDNKIPNVVRQSKQFNLSSVGGGGEMGLGGVLSEASVENNHNIWS